MNDLPTAFDLIRQHLRDTYADTHQAVNADVPGQALTEFRGDADSPAVLMVFDGGTTSHITSRHLTMIEQLDHDHGFQTEIVNGTTDDLVALLTFLELE